MKKIDMDKRAKEFKEHTGGYVNPLAAAILQQQLWRIRCDNCGKEFECSEGSPAFKKQLCSRCQK